jgi:hypothetical protein
MLTMPTEKKGGGDRIDVVYYLSAVEILSEGESVQAN